MSSSGSVINNLSPLKPRLAIIGGSGLCNFPEVEVLATVRPETKYGLPSDEIVIGKLAGQIIAFLPRHGVKHSLAPHKVPYKANLLALKDLGVQLVIGTCIVGSLRREITPGSVVVPDQFVNLTWGRDDYTEADGGQFIHLPMGEPYCARLRSIILEESQTLRFNPVLQATVAVIQGPRFSTKAESMWLSANGWDIVNMTQYPECYLARELGLCYAAVATVTDYDVGLQESLVIDPNKMEEVLKVFKSNIDKTKVLLHRLAGGLKTGFNCGCAQILVKPYYEEGA